MQVAEMKTRIEEKIRALEKEKSMLLDEVRQLREVVELSEKSKSLENEVDALKKEAEMLRKKLPREFLIELGELPPELLEKDEEECLSCEEEEPY